MGRIKEIIAHFGRQPHKETPPVSYGFISINGENTPITHPAIWAGHAHCPIIGEVTSDTRGIIETVHSPISLKIKNPTRRVFPTPENVIDAIQQIGTTDNFPLLRQRDNLALQTFNDIAKYENLRDVMSELQKPLKKLSINQSIKAQSLAEDASRRLASLKNKAILSKVGLSIFTMYLSSIYNDIYNRILTVSSVFGDILIDVEDPQTAILVASKSNYGRAKLSTEGHAPENPKRSINVFTEKGRVIVKYPQK